MATGKTTRTIQPPAEGERHAQPIISASDVTALAAHIEHKRGTMPKQQFAAAIGATRVMVHKWETGANKPGSNYLQRLGLETCFRVVDDRPLPEDAPAAPVSQASRGLGAAAAKKQARMAKGAQKQGSKRTQ